MFKQMDYSITYYLNHLGTGTYIDIMSEIISSLSFLAILLLIVAALIIFIDKKNCRWVLLTILIAIILHYLVDELFFKHFLSDFVYRLRPYLEFPNDMNSIGEKLIDSSFPSSHVAGTAATLTVIVYYYRKFWPFAVIFIILMMFSRIHNGMHYSTDTLAGLIFGILYGILAITIVKSIKKRYPSIKG